ncbi:MAG: glycoside hydrolase family 28 protein [Bacteroidia bacterium]|nr:glycoside hydrolase family 28 protein [Bacteroidia bacterium]
MKRTKLSIFLIPIFILTSLNCWSKDYNILDYGAVGNGTTLNTAAIQSTVDACSNSGGGRVIIPSGKYLSGTIVLKSNVELYFEHSSTILGSPHKEDYPLQPVPRYRSLRDDKGFCALIYAEGIENIAITGNGTIDGQGQFQKVVRDLDDSPDLRPRNITFISCKNIRVEGLSINNSGNWNQHYLDCEDVIVQKVSVYNHCNYNNDAIDIDGCRRFVLSDCIFDSDDDGITLKSTGTAPSEDILISNCIVSSYCNAIKAGTESTGGFRNIVISNCIVKPSRSPTTPYFNTPKIGITGLSLIIVDGGTMEGISVNNLTIYGTMAPLYIRLGNRARKHAKDAPEPEVGKVNNISINNVVAYGAGSWGSSITGIPGYPVKNISLNNIQLFMNGGIKQGGFNKIVKEDERGYPQPSVWDNLPVSGLYIRHAEGISIHNIVFGVEKPDERVPVMADDVSGLQISGSRLSGHDINAQELYRMFMERIPSSAPVCRSISKGVQEPSVWDDGHGHHPESLPSYY